MSKAYEFGNEVGVVRIRPGIITDLVIENDQGIEQITMDNPYALDGADGAFIATTIQRQSQEAEQADAAVMAENTRIRRYGTIALTTAAGVVIVAGVIKGIRVWHKRELQSP